MKSSPERTVRLVESVSINPEVRHLVFEAVGERRIDFTPGQHLCLSAALHGERVERYYSIASAPAGDNRFEVCVKVLTQGGGFGQHRRKCNPAISSAAKVPPEPSASESPYGTRSL